MKSNELQIGDWVNVTSKFVSVCKNGAATSNTISNIETRAAKVNFLTNKEIFTDASTIREFLLEPIPLTAEILEKNGIKKRGDEYVVIGWYGETQWWYVTLEDFKPQFDFWFITSFDRDLNVRGKIRYVHQLQHALRLCGLNDLADNFEI